MLYSKLIENPNKSQIKQELQGPLAQRLSEIGQNIRVKILSKLPVEKGNHRCNVVVPSQKPHFKSLERYFSKNLKQTTIQQRGKQTTKIKYGLCAFAVARKRYRRSNFKNFSSPR